jgi:putative ABC transport system permease protein
MLKNYLVVALRRLRRRPGYTAINVAGLALGLACCLLIGLYVGDALSFDRFHAEADRLYRLTFESRIGEDLGPAAPDEYRVWGSAAIAPLLEAEFPEVEHAVRVSGQHALLLSRGERAFQEERYLFADSTFFEAFTFPLLQGDPRTALARPGSLILAESAAQRYFGDEDPMGQTLYVNGDRVFTVTGVMREVPATSHLDFDLLLSMVSFEREAPDFMFESWGYIDFFTYVLLRDGASAEAVHAKLPAFIERHHGENLQEPPQTYTLALEPITDAYLSPVGGRQPGPKGNATNLYLFSFVGLFILLIACVNFTNLATAQAAQRAREVGVRKTLGARRGGLVGQFLFETVLLASVAMGLALLAARLAMPAFRTLAGRAISAQPLSDPVVLAVLGGLTLVVGLLAGSYPALVLSAFRPAAVLKGSFATSARGTALRKGLVVVQFAIATALIASTLVVRTQLDYLQGYPLGFEPEQQLVVDFGGDRTVTARLDALKEALGAHPAVHAVAATRSVPGGYFPHASTRVEDPSGELQEFVPGLFEVDFDVLPQLGVGVAAGRHFDRAFAADSTEALLLNEAAAHALGYADPDDAVGKRFTQWGREGTIVGVVRDFNYESLRTAIEPLTFRIAPENTGQFVLAVARDDVTQTVADLRAQWATLVPHRPFLFRFLDDSFDALYRSETRFGQVFAVFGGLAIFIACLGLFGLAAYTTQQRRKEIGVRKVLGASVPRLIALLSKDLVRLVAVGFAIATPVAYIGMSHWLETFAYRAALGPELFLLAGGLALTIALVTVSVHAVRAATADPVQSLRTE